MNRRDFITLLGSAAAWPVAARAQQAGKVPRIGYMAGSLESPDQRVLLDAFRQGVREHGYVEGQKHRAAAGALRVQLRLVAVREAADIARAFSTMAAERTDTLFILPSPMLFTERRQIVDLAARHRLPSIAMAREFVELSGLMAYGASIPDLNRRAGDYVDRILRGAKPADLPVEQASKYQLVVNLNTAKALGIEMPPTLLARADKVIE
jgi:ABC-type uncharacterized transport system substrate-binding protein